MHHRWMCLPMLCGLAALSAACRVVPCERWNEDLGTEYKDCTPSGDEGEGEDTGRWEGEVSLDEADVRILGAEPYGRVGTAMMSAGDLDGDGSDEILVSAGASSLGPGYSGSIYLVAGLLSAGDQELPRDRDGLWTGEASSAAGVLPSEPFDMDGDGAGDLLVGATSYTDDERSGLGAVYVALGPEAGANASLADAGTRIYGVDERGYFGSALLGAKLDADDDSRELIVGQPGDGSGGATSFEARVRVYVSSDWEIGSIQADAASVTLLRSEDADLGGYSLARLDMDGDGGDDLVVGAPGTTCAGAGQTCGGVVYVIEGSEWTSMDGMTLSDVQRLVLRGAAGDSASTALAARDLDGDGHPDLIVGAPTASSSRGRVYVVPDLPSLESTGGRSLDDVGVKLEGTEESGFAGYSVASPGDVDGDDAGDLLIGAPEEEGEAGAADDAGAAYLVYGPITAPLTLEPAEGVVRFYGDPGDTFAGSSVAGAGDVNADGREDLLIGAVSWDNPEVEDPDQGAVYVLFGR